MIPSGGRFNLKGLAAGIVDRTPSFSPASYLITRPSPKHWSRARALRETGAPATAAADGSLGNG
jgi:hypothetical protein